MIRCCGLTATVPMLCLVFAPDRWGRNFRGAGVFHVSDANGGNRERLKAGINTKALRAQKGPKNETSG